MNQKDALAIVESQIMTCLEKDKDGVTNDYLLNSIDAEDSEIQQCLNILVESGKIIPLEIKGQVLWKVQTEREASKMKNLTMDENQVYDLVIAAGNNGIFTKEVQDKTKLSATALKGIFDGLSKKFLIKNICIANSKNKKVWIGYDIEPSTKIKGDVWCNSNQEYDKNLIEVIKGKCFDYLKRQRVCSRKELFVCVKSLDLIKVEQ